MAFMLDCFSKVAAVHPRVGLRIVGSGQFMGKVRELVEDRYSDLDSEIRDRIHFSEMPGFLSSIDVGLLPLIQGDDPWVNSKSPAKYFEYLSSGLPTVASPTAGLNRFVRDGEHGFLARTKQEFINKMLLLAEDGLLRKNMGRAAREPVERNFSIEGLGEKLYSIITEAALER